MSLTSWPVQTLGKREINAKLTNNGHGNAKHSALGASVNHQSVTYTKRLKIGVITIDFSSPLVATNAQAAAPALQTSEWSESFL